MKRLRRFLKRSYIVTLREIKETKAMIRVFVFKEKEHYKEASKQLLDIFKIVMLLPILILPGSAIILTMLQIIARFLGMSIFPKKQHLRGKKTS